jgi:hypothetical protein
MWKQDGASTYYLELRNGTAPIAGQQLGYAGWSLIDVNADYNGNAKTDLMWKQDGVNGAGAYYMEYRNGLAAGAGSTLGYAGWSLGGPDLELKVQVSLETAWGVREHAVVGLCPD